MKKFVFLSLALATALCSCSVKHHFADNGDFCPDCETIVSLSFPAYTIEPMTKAVTGVGDLVTRLDVWLISGTDTTVVSQTKADNADNFGVISVVLNKTKTYTLYAVGHKSNFQAILDNGVISFSDNRILDTFCYTTTFCPADNNDLTCLMQRAVGLFKFIIQDAQPANLAKVRFTVSGSGLSYDLTTNSPTNIGDKVSVINNPSTNNEGYTTFNIYCFAPSTTSSVSVAVTAMDADENTIQARIFVDVPIRAGYMTTYTGQFFTNMGVGGTFTVNTDWSDGQTVNY